MTPDPLSGDDAPTGSGSAQQRRRYRKTQAQYARMYRVSVPTVKRWLRRGLPLDDPEALASCLTPGGCPATITTSAPEVRPRWRDVPEREW